MNNELQDKSFYFTATPYKYIVISLFIYIYTYTCVWKYLIMFWGLMQRHYFIWQLSPFTTRKFAFDVQKITYLLE